MNASRVSSRAKDRQQPGLYRGHKRALLRQVFEAVVNPGDFAASGLVVQADTDFEIIEA